MKKLKSENSALLVYKQAEEEILRIIEQRGYTPGDRVPSERELSERFGIHRMTVRKAIDGLIAEGVLERRGTSGTYLPAPVIVRPVSAVRYANSLTDIVKQCGGVAGSRLLFFEQDAASQRVAEKLEIDRGAKVIVIKRLRTVDNLPFCIETSWLPAARVPGIAADDLTGDQSLYAVLSERYGIKMGEDSTTITAATVASSYGELLGLKSGESALIMHSVIRDVAEVPVEYVASVNQPRRVMLRD